MKRGFFFPFSNSSPQSGIQLLEVMIALGILGVVTMALTQFNVSNTRSKRQIRLKVVQESLAKNIESKLKTPSSVYTSLLQTTENANFINCVLGTNRGCSESQTDNRNGTKNIFSMFNPSLMGQASQLSNSASKKIYYSAKGVPNCNPEANDCIFTIDTFYYATCPVLDNCLATSTQAGLDAQNTNLAPPKTCQCGAAEVFLGYQVKQVKKEKIEDVEIGSLLKPYPDNDEISFTRLTAEDILGPSLTSRCNPGATISGYGSNGKALCKCSLPYVRDTQIPLNLHGEVCREVNAKELQCPENQIFKGFQDNGTALCINATDAYDCQTITQYYSSNITPSTCPTSEYWISKFSRKNCRFVCFVGKGGGVCGSADQDLVVLTYDDDEGTTRIIDPIQRKAQKYTWKSDVDISDFSATEKLNLLTLLIGSDKTNYPYSIDDGEFKGYAQEGLICDQFEMECCKYRDITK